MLQEYLKYDAVKINEFPKEIIAKIEILTSGKCLHLSLNQLLPPDFDIRDFIKVFVVANRYIEIILKKGYFDGKDGVFDFVKAKIAHDFRQNPRFAIENEEFIADNYQLNSIHSLPLRNCSKKPGIC